MPVRKTTTLLASDTKWEVRDQQQLVILRNEVKRRAAAMGMSLVNQTKLMTAASELGRNMLRYGQGGEVTLRERHQASKVGLQLVFADEGPGIANVEAALRDGYSTGWGLGLGLPGTRRLMDEFSIKSAVGQGTTVTITKWQ